MENSASMSLADVLANRRSVRSYALDRLDPKVIRGLLGAAVRAPTAIHQEPWSFVIVQNKVLLKRISDRARPLFLEEMHRAHMDREGHAPAVFADPAFNVFHDAGTLIVICGNPARPYVVADCWLAAENLMLAATAAGLGTCVIGSAVAALNTDEIKRELDIPQDISAIAPLVVGVPAAPGSQTPRKEPRILSWK